MKCSRIQQNNPDSNAKSRDEFDFEKLVKASSMSLPCEGMTKKRSHRTKYKQRFREIQLIWDFVTEIIVQKIRKGRTYGSMGFVKRKAMKKLLKTWNKMI